MAIPSDYRLLTKDDIGKTFGVDLELDVYIDVDNFDIGNYVPITSDTLSLTNFITLERFYDEIGYEAWVTRILLNDELMWEMGSWIYWESNYTMPNDLKVESYYDSNWNVWFYVKDKSDPYSIKIKNKEGIKLLTKDKLLIDDVKVTIDESLLGGGASVLNSVKVTIDESLLGGGASVLDSVSYYKTNRPSNWPYFPLPSEMTEEEDVIYMLYDANVYMCCPAFNVTFTSCICTIMKYMDTKLVDSYTESVTSNTVKYLQFYEEDEDYSTYNYIVIKLQGNIKSHYLNYASKFNGIVYPNECSSELLEVSGKCNSCDVKVINSNSSGKFHTNLKYYSFLGVSTQGASVMFWHCHSLQAIPELDTSNFSLMYETFHSCHSLQAIPELDTSKVDNMYGLFTDCYTLTAIPKLKTENVKYMANMFKNCYSLQILPDEIDTRSVISDANGFDYMFYNCKSLKKAPKINTSNAKVLSYMFAGCILLQIIPELNMSNANNTTNIFTLCSLLQKLNVINPHYSFSLADCLTITRKNIVNVLNNLPTISGTQTLNLGITNLAKLTNEDKAIATNKGWTLT